MQLFCFGGTRGPSGLYPRCPQKATNIFRNVFPNQVSHGVILISTSVFPSDQILDSISVPYNSCSCKLRNMECTSLSEQLPRIPNLNETILDGFRNGLHSVRVVRMTVHGVLVVNDAQLHSFMDGYQPVRPRIHNSCGQTKQAGKTDFSFPGYVSPKS